MQICEAVRILKNKENNNIKNIYLLTNFVIEFSLSFRTTQKQYIGERKKQSSAYLYPLGSGKACQ